MKYFLLIFFVFNFFNFFMLNEEIIYFIAIILIFFNLFIVFKKYFIELFFNDIKKIIIFLKFLLFYKKLMLYNNRNLIIKNKLILKNNFLTINLYNNYYHSMYLKLNLLINNLISFIYFNYKKEIQIITLKKSYNFKKKIYNLKIFFFFIHN